MLTQCIHWGAWGRQLTPGPSSFHFPRIGSGLCSQFRTSSLPVSQITAVLWLELATKAGVGGEEVGRCHTWHSATPLALVVACEQTWRFRGQCMLVAS